MKNKIKKFIYYTVFGNLMILSMRLLYAYVSLFLDASINGVIRSFYGGTYWSSVLLMGRYFGYSFGYIFFPLLIGIFAHIFDKRFLTFEEED